MAGSPSRPAPWLTLVKLIAALVAAGVLAAGLALPYVGGLGLATGHEAGKFLNTVCNLTEAPPPRKTVLYARDGKTVLATLFKEDRVPIPLSQVPTYLQRALIDTEDRRFYEHHGVDMRGLLRSAVSTSNGDTQGGSTLTMQYVKQVRYFQAIKNKNPTAAKAAVATNAHRKMEDMQCAIAIEKRENKDTILDNYLNIAFFGENSYSLQSAAETYFGKPASQLTLPESAVLVGLLRAPTDFDPFLHPEASRTRRNQVLQNMVAVGDLSQVQATKFEALPIQLATTHPPLVKEGCVNAPHNVRNIGFFCQYVVDWLKTSGGLSMNQLQTGGYKIVTTLDPRIQDTVQKNIAAAVPPKGPTTAIMPVVDPHTGDILAMATSKAYGLPTSRKDQAHTTLPIFRDYTGFGASTYKLFPLLTALSTGIPSDWQLKTVDPYHPACLTSSKKGVQNGDAAEHYDNNETLASATAKSQNTYFLELVDQILQCNLKPVVTMAKSLGMTSLSRPSGEVKGATIGQVIVNNQRSQQLVLGSVGTSPLGLASAYAAVANDGEYNAPAPVLSITAANGQNVKVARPEPKQVINPQVAREAVQILTGDTQSPGTSADPFKAWYAKNPSIVAGKTGTAQAAPKTSENGTIWFVGMTPSLVAATELVNLDSPFAPSSGLPGAKTGTAYGDYASGIWVKALLPVLRKQHWTWPAPNAVPGELVPDITGHTMADAAAMLKAAGFTMRRFDASNATDCPSTEPPGSVGYYAPTIAFKGAAITVCPSSGNSQPIWTPPLPPAPKVEKPTPPQSGHGGSAQVGHGGTGRTGHDGSGSAGSGGAGNGQRHGQGRNSGGLLGGLINGVLSGGHDNNRGNGGDHD